MWLDLAAILIVALYTALGYFQGIIAQVFRLIGLVLVFVHVWLVAEPVGQWLAVHLGVNALGAYYVSLIGGALVLYAACALLGKTVHGMVAKTETPQTLDRVLGMALGGVKGAVVAFLCLCMIDMVPPEGMGDWPWLQRQAGASVLVVRVHPWNPMPELRFLADLEAYRTLLTDELAQKILQKQEAAVRLQDNAKFRMAASDPELDRMIREASDSNVEPSVRQRRWLRVLRNEKVLALVFDRDVRRLLNRLRPTLALDEAARMRGERK